MSLKALLFLPWLLDITYNPCYSIFAFDSTLRVHVYSSLVVASGISDSFIEGHQRYMAILWSIGMALFLFLCCLFRGVLDIIFVSCVTIEVPNFKNRSPRRGGIMDRRRLAKFNILSIRPFASLRPRTIAHWPSNTKLFRGARQQPRSDRCGGVRFK